MKCVVTLQRARAWLVALTLSCTLSTKAIPSSADSYLPNTTSAGGGGEWREASKREECKVVGR